MGIFFQKSRKEDELILVLHVGSSVVMGALFLAQDSGNPKIIFSTRELVAVEEEMDVDKLLFSTMKTLQIVVDKVYRVSKGTPSKIFCILSPFLCVSQTRTIVLKKNTPFVFTTTLADELVKKEIHLFEEEYLKGAGNTDKTIRTIELKNIKIMLNGYETPKPLDQKTKELEMTIFISMSGEHVLRKIEDVVGKHFHFPKIHYASLTLASFTMLRDIYTKQEDFLLIDVDGEMTNISMVKKNALRESSSFPLGRNFLARGVASELGVTLAEANSLISLFKDDHATKSTTSKLEPIINKLKEAWLKNFQESLANISNDISIPATIFLVLDQELADFFAETIKTEQFNQYTLTESKFQVIILSNQVLHGMAMFEDNVVREPYLVLDSIYINRFLTKL